MTQHIYELRSINLHNLPEDEQAVVLDKFVSFLNSLNEPVTIDIIEDQRKVEAIGATYCIPYKRYFLTSPSPLDNLISALGTRCVPGTSKPGITISAVGPKYIIDQESQYFQVYVVTKLGGRNPAGFLGTLYPLLHSARIELHPINIYDAKKLARSHALSVGSKLIIRKNEGRSIDPEDQLEFDRANVASQLVSSGSERLFRMRLKIILGAKSYGELQEKRKRLRQSAGALFGEIDSPRWLQKPLLTGIGPKSVTGRWFYVTTSSAASFFPFAGLDLVDRNGVFLGRNLQTGNAVMYDLFDKENYNVAIIGNTGYGKSTLIKSFLSRLALQRKDMMLFVFDSIVRPEYAVGPDGVYESSFAGITGCRVHRFDRTRGSGLDPFAIFGDRRRAANFLASVVKVEDDPDLLADLFIAAEKSSCMEELVSNSGADLRKRLDANLPPYRFLFKGSMDIYSRMVFVLYDLPPGELRDAAAFLTLSALWREIQSIPVHVPKVIVVDEGWALVETNPRTGRPYFPLAVEYVPEIARTGRHYNTAFIVATQRVADLMGSGEAFGPGRTLIESCATKIILKQDQAAYDILRDRFKLSEREIRTIIDSRIGEEILMCKDGHMPLFNYLSDVERRMFSTKPEEVKA